MQHPSLAEWEKHLLSALAEVNDILEKQYGHHFNLHPARAPHGTTSDPRQDGLFDIDANFTLGLGSSLGKGYVLKIRFATLDPVPNDLRIRVESEAISHLKKALEKYFKGRSLIIKKDGNDYKISGDLSLGDVYK